MSEIAWFCVTLGLLVLVVGLQVAADYLWIRGIRGTDHETRHRARGRNSNPRATQAHPPAHAA